MSILAGGTFQPPVEIGGSLAGASSSPVVAAGAGGLLVVGFLSGSQLYIAQRRSGATALGTPRALASGAANPALAMSSFGKTYLAFTVPDGTGFDVRAAFAVAGVWSIESTPLNVIRGDDSGTGAGRPTVTAAGDGVGIVAWGEGGHVFSRRVWGTAPSTVTEQGDGPLPGCSETSADEPALGSGGDSSYAALALHETLVCGGVTQSRVLVNRLHGSRYEGVHPADGPLATGADHPRVAVGEYGSGWVTAEAGGQRRLRHSAGPEREGGLRRSDQRSGEREPPLRHAVDGRSVLVDRGLAARSRGGRRAGDPGSVRR